MNVSIPNVNTINALYYGFFGITLFISPSFFYGNEGLLPYFSKPFAPNAVFFGHMFGSSMITILAAGLMDKGSASLAKAFALGNVCSGVWIVSAALDGGEEHPQPIWILQVIVHALLTAATFSAAFAAKGGKSKSK